MKFVFVKAEDITPELLAMQPEAVPVLETVYYEFADGIYGVLMVAQDIPGYVCLTKSEALTLIEAETITSFMLP